MATERPPLHGQEPATITSESLRDPEAASRRLKLAARVFGAGGPRPEDIPVLSRVSADAMRAVLSRRGWSLVGVRYSSAYATLFETYERNGSLPRAYVPVAEVAIAADRADHVATWCAAVALRHGVSAAEILAEAMGADFRGDR